MFKLNRRTLAGLTAVALLAGGTGNGRRGHRALRPRASFHRQAQNQNQGTAPGRQEVADPRVLRDHAHQPLDRPVDRSPRTLLMVGPGLHRRPVDGGLDADHAVRRLRPSAEGAVQHHVEQRKRRYLHGTIDPDGYLTGTTRDRKNANAQAGFEFSDTIECGRY